VQIVQTVQLDAYIFINYLLMNLLVEENHDESKHDYYELLTKKYFDESYEKFSDNAEYLFFTATTAVFSEWFFDIDVEDYEKMFKDAIRLDPENPLYKSTEYRSLDIGIPKNKKIATSYAKKVLGKNSFIKKTLDSKGAVGEYIWMLLSSHWKEMVKKWNLFENNYDHLNLK